MSELVRLSLSLEKNLCDELGERVRASGCRNRSEFIRQLLRDHLVAEAWADDGAEVMGTITILYDHHQANLSAKLTRLQHDFGPGILAATHVHLSHEICAESIILKGRADAIRRLADAIRQQRGVLHVGVLTGSTGETLPH